MVSRKRITLGCFYLLLSLFATNASAQKSRLITPPPSWEYAQDVMEHRRIDLVTTAKPNARKHCTVVQVDEDSVTCARSFDSPITYTRDEIEAVIARASGGRGLFNAWSERILGLIMFGGLGYAIDLIAITGPAGAGVAGLLAVGAGTLFLLSLALAVNEPVGPPPPAQREAIVYIKPGTTYKGHHA